MRFTFALLGLPAALLRKRDPHGSDEVCNSYTEKPEDPRTDDDLIKGCLEANCNLLALHKLGTEAGDAEYDIECTAPAKIEAPKGSDERKTRMRKDCGADETPDENGDCLRNKRMRKQYHKKQHRMRH